MLVATDVAAHEHRRLDLFECQATCPLTNLMCTLKQPSGVLLPPMW